ncbi:hypothetical protein BRADI_5g14520v3 [Brachypodium distachyon]|uniref:Uncharacterized protein n=1 Tax=Brachypodium distachyon TaxID=15368 RepID=A0A0Q3H528_BRADI|nr:hypothetical protein BRADI_5g14520v3 [Brachypodium distachyon]
MRKFVHLVLKYRHTLNEFSVRNIDTSRFFRPASMPPGPFSFPTEPSDLPPQAISFSPPYLGCGSAVAEMDFMLLGGEHNKLLAVDQEGNSILYDPIGNNTRAMPPLASPKSMSLSLTVGGTDLYAMNQIPSWPPTANPVFHDHDFEGILFDQQQQGYDCCALPPTPCRFKDFSPSHGSILSYVVAGGGSSIWITKHEMGTYSFDTRTRLWSKVGDWSLPILGRESEAAGQLCQLGACRSAQGVGLVTCGLLPHAPGLGQVLPRQVLRQ